MPKPKVISQWRKFYNNKMINIVVKHSDWWYQAFIDDKPITRAEVLCEKLEDILYGNGCQKRNKGSFMYKKNVNLVDWQKIDWDKI